MIKIAAKTTAPTTTINGTDTQSMFVGLNSVGVALMYTIFVRFTNLRLINTN